MRTEPSPWPSLDADAAVRLGRSLSSVGFNALALTADELAVVAFNVFLEVRKPPPPAPRGSRRRVRKHHL